MVNNERLGTDDHSGAGSEMATTPTKTSMPCEKSPLSEDADTDTAEEPPKQLKAEGGWGWLVVAGAAIINMMFGINYRMFGLVYLEMRERFDASATASVWVGGVNLLLGGFCGPVGAWLLERYSHRTVTAVGATLATIGMIGTGYVPNLPLAYVTYGLLTGIGIALAHLSAVAMVGEYFDKRKALALALQSVTSGLSAVLFSPLMALLFTEFNYPGTFLIFGGIFTNMFISSALFRPLGNRSVRRKTQNDKEPTAEAPQGRKYAVYDMTTSHMQVTGKQDHDITGKPEHKLAANGTKSTQGTSDKMPSTSNTAKQKPLCSGCTSMYIALQNPVFLSFFFLLLSVTAGRAVTSCFLPALALEFGTTLTEASLLPAISGVSAAAGSLLVGAAFDTKPVRRYRVYLYTVNTFIIGATMLWMPFTSTFAGLAVPTAINGVSSTVIFAQQMTVLTDLLGKKHAVAGLGIVRVALALGSILGRSVSAIFVDVFATNKFGFYITSCFPMVASVFFAVVVFVHSREDKHSVDTATAV